MSDGPDEENLKSTFLDKFIDSPEKTQLEKRREYVRFLEEERAKTAADIQKRNIYSVGGTLVRGLTFEQLFEIPGVVVSSKGKGPRGVVNELSLQNQISCNPDLRLAIRYNLFLSQVETTLDPEYPGKWTTISNKAVRSFLGVIQLNKIMEKATMSVMRNAMNMASMELSLRVHPLRDYLEALEIEDDPNLSFFTDFFSAEDTLYNAWLGRAFLTAAVNRIMVPGCPMDWMPVLVGGQGLGKSKGMEALFGTKYNKSNLEDFSKKDFFLNLQGAWGVEIEELAGFRASSIERIKAVISSKQDVYRFPYDILPSTIPRQCVFYATTNDSDFLVDPTGNRRFLPVKINGPVRVEKIRAARDKIWAAGVSYWKKNFNYWDVPKYAHEALGELHDSFSREDPWEEKLHQYIASEASKGRDYVSTSDFLNFLHDGDTSKLNRGHSMRVAGILRKWNFQKISKRIDGRIKKVYKRIKN